MSIKQFIIKNFSGTVKALQLFHVLRFSVALLIGIVIVNSGVPIADFSSYEYFLFITSLVSFFWTNGLLKSMMSQYHNYGEQDKKALLTNVAVLLISFAFVVSLVMIGISYYGPDILGSESLILLILYFFFSSVGAMGELILVLKDQGRSLFRYGIIIYALQFILVVNTILFNGKLSYILLAMVSWAFLRFIYSMYLLYHNGSRTIQIQKVFTLLIFALPLIGESLLGDAMKFIDGGLVKYFFEDESYFALYRTGARELPFSILIIGAIGTAIIPLLSKNLDKGLELMKTEIHKAMRWLFPLSIVLMLLSPFIFPILYEESFSLSAEIFNIYLLLIISRVLMPHIVLLVKHENTILFWMALIELVLNFGLSILLLHQIGILGIPLASLIAFLVIKILMMFILYKKYQIPFSAYMDMKYYVGFSIALLCSYFVSLYIVN